MFDVLWSVDGPRPRLTGGKLTKPSPDEAAARKQALEAS